MKCASINEKKSVLLFRLKKQRTIDMRDAEPTFLSNAVTGSGFVVDVFEELESL